MADEVIKVFNKLDSGSINISISTLAYVKIVLHAFKHSAARIGGYLIGNKTATSVIF
jgi:hypothetical protein